MVKNSAKKLGQDLPPSHSGNARKKAFFIGGLYRTAFKVASQYSASSTPSAPPVSVFRAPGLPSMKKEKNGRRREKVNSGTVRCHMHMIIIYPASFSSEAPRLYKHTKTNEPHGMFHPHTYM